MREQFVENGNLEVGPKVDDRVSILTARRESRVGVVTAVYTANSPYRRFTETNIEVQYGQLEIGAEREAEVFTRRGGSGEFRSRNNSTIVSIL